MGRAPCCAKVGLQRGPWTPDEDSLLLDYIQAHGEGHWRSLPKKAGLLRCGKSCRLRWMNYLRPDIIRGNISPEEEDLILRLHALLGNKWSLIAGRLPGRTDNEIKNYWNTHLSKKLRGINPARKKKSKKKTENARNEEKQKIHLPKAVTVTSLSLTRNNSLASLESNVSNSTTSNFSRGEAPSQQTNMTMMMMMEENTGEDEVMDLGLQDHPHASDLDKLYQEYFQLLQTDDDFDSNEAQELDSFADSLLM